MSQPLGAVPVVPDDDGAGAHLRVWFPQEAGHLGADLARQPYVIVVAEGHQVSLERHDSGISGTSEPRAAEVATDADRPLATALELMVGWDLVVDDDYLDPAGVVLLSYSLQGQPNELGSVSGGDDNADGGQR